jgi:hypothetical protein
MAHAGTERSRFGACPIRGHDSLTYLEGLLRIEGEFTLAPICDDLFAWFPLV